MSARRTCWSATLSDGSWFGETDALVAQKFAAALRAGLVPILVCW